MLYAIYRFINIEEVSEIIELILEKKENNLESEKDFWFKKKHGNRDETVESPCEL